MATSTSAGGRDQAEADVEAVGEEEGVAGVQVGGDLGLVDRGLLGVGQQDHDQVGLGGGIGHRQDPQSGLLGLGPGRRALAQADPHVDPGLGQVEGVGVALGAVADDGHLAVPDEARRRRPSRSTAWPSSLNLPSLCRVRRAGGRLGAR